MDLFKSGDFQGDSDLDVLVVIDRVNVEEEDMV